MANEQTTEWAIEPAAPLLAKALEALTDRAMRRLLFPREVKAALDALEAWRSENGE